eukprot:1654154-Rhodomonas_salina.2
MTADPKEFVKAAQKSAAQFGQETILGYTEPTSGYRPICYDDDACLMNQDSHVEGERQTNRTD